MAITLPPDLEERLEAEVAAGRAKSVGEYVERAVRAELEWNAELQQSLDDAEEDYRKNGGIPWETVRARLSARFDLDD